MSNRDAAKLGFRLMGLWFMANAAVSIAGIPILWDPRLDEVRGMALFTVVLPALVAVGIGVPVWFSADWFAARTFPSGEGQVSSGPLRGEPLFALALAIIGALLICESLPALVSGLALFIQSRSVGLGVLGPARDIESQLWHAEAKANVAAAVARLVIGVALVAGPANLARAVARVRKEFTGNVVEE